MNKKITLLIAALLSAATATQGENLTYTTDWVGNSNPTSTLGDITFTMGSITGGQVSEHVTEFAFTYLTETVLNGLTVTVTATFSDQSTSTVTRTVNRNTTSPVDDTFFGFNAPSGTYILSVALTSNTTRGETTHIDDVGFVTAVVP